MKIKWRNWLNTKAKVHTLTKDWGLFETSTAYRQDESKGIITLSTSIKEKRYLFELTEVEALKLQKQLTDALATVKLFKDKHETMKQYVKEYSNG